MLDFTTINAAIAQSNNVHIYISPLNAEQLHNITCNYNVPINIIAQASMIMIVDNLLFLVRDNDYTQSIINIINKF